MKTEYPDYRITTTKNIEEKLNPEDKTTLNDFLQQCRVTASKERIEGKIKPIMLEFFDIIGNLTNWKQKDIQNFLILLNYSNKTEYTKNDIKKTLRRFIRFYYKDNDMLSLIKCKSDINSFNYEKINENTLITLEEFENMLKCANTLKQKAILSVLFETGCRPQELRMLKWSDIKLD